MGAYLGYLPRWIFGATAIGLAIYFISISGLQGAPIFIASIFFLLAVAIDTVSSKIPNVLTVPLLIAGLAYQASEAGALGALDSFLGILTGFALLVIPYALGGMGGGDVKALAALGALLGPGETFQVFLYMGLLGGGMALILYPLNGQLRQKVKAFVFSIMATCLTRNPGNINASSLLPEERKKAVTFPYASALALGYYAYIWWGGLV